MTHKDFAVEMAKKAGTLIKANFKNGMKKELKADQSPVTETDLAINKMVMDAVRSEFPDYGYVGEEGSNYSGQEFAWVCDPVDGTIPFSYGVPASTFMLGLIQNGRAILGVIYDPFNDKMYFAEKGNGAYLNDEPIHVSNVDKIAGSAVGILGWKNAKYHLPGLNQALVDMNVMDFNIPSVGYLDVLVAVGEFTAVICPGDKPWDCAAPKVIVEEAGGKFTDLFGNGDLDFRESIRGQLITNGFVHEEMLKLVKENLVEAK